MAGDQTGEAWPVERGIGAAVAGERAGVQAHQDQRGGGRRGEREHRPACAWPVAGNVMGEIAIDAQLARAELVQADAGRFVRAGGGEGALDGRLPCCRGKDGRSDQQRAERDGHTHARQAPSRHRHTHPDEHEGDQHGCEPAHVVLFVQDHELRRDARAGRQR